MSDPLSHMNDADWKGEQDKFEPLSTYRDTAAKEAVTIESMQSVAQIKHRVEDEMAEHRKHLGLKD